MIPKSAVKTMTLRMLPFADAASDELPLGQLLRLSLFQISVGMAAVIIRLKPKKRTKRRDQNGNGDHRRHDESRHRQLNNHHPV